MCSVTVCPICFAADNSSFIMYCLVAVLAVERLIRSLVESSRPSSEHDLEVSTSTARLSWSASSILPSPVPDGTVSAAVLGVLGVLAAVVSLDFFGVMLLEADKGRSAKAALIILSSFSSLKNYNDILLSKSQATLKRDQQSFPLVSILNHTCTYIVYLIN